ncbi:Protein OXY-5 [Aphelenchoides avenae]|nr:Protein OXY-5 [Aphelenchus avenae]
MLFTTAQKLSAAAARQPMIKFVGARLPRPQYDPSKLPPLPPASASSSSSASSKGASRGPVLDEFDLPAHFRRKPLSDEEIIVINTLVKREE